MSVGICVVSLPCCTQDYVYHKNFHTCINITNNPDKSEYFFAGLKDGGASILLSMFKKNIYVYIFSNRELINNFDNKKYYIYSQKTASDAHSIDLSWDSICFSPFQIFLLVVFFALSNRKNVVIKQILNENNY